LPHLYQNGLPCVGRGVAVGEVKMVKKRNGNVLEIFVAC